MTAVAKEELPELPDGWFWEGLSGSNLDQPPWIARSEADSGCDCYLTEEGLFIDSIGNKPCPFEIVRLVLQANGVSL